MKQVAIVPIALLAFATPALAQFPEVKPNSLVATGSRVTVETVLTRLMSFDRNNDGKVAVEELPERMQPLLASASEPLDRNGLRNLATQTRSTIFVPGVAGGGYGFGDTGFPTGDTTSSLIDGAIEDLRLPASSRERALAVGRQFVDIMKADADAALLKTLMGVLSPAQLKAFTVELRRKSEVHPIDTPDGRHITLVIRPNFEQTLRKYGLTSAQLLKAIPSLATHDASLRLNDQRRAALLTQLSDVLAADDRADLEAALQRRPLVKNVMVMQANSAGDAVKLVAQLTAMASGIAGPSVK